MVPTTPASSTDQSPAALPGRLKPSWAEPYPPGNDIYPAELPGRLRVALRQEQPVRTLIRGGAQDQPALPLEVLDVSGGLGQRGPAHEPRDLLPAAGPGQALGHLPQRGLGGRWGAGQHLAGPGVLGP